MEKEKSEKAHGVHKAHSHHKNKKSVASKIRGNPWIISTFVLGLLVLIILITGSSGATGKIVSEKQASENLLNFLNTQTGGGVEYVSSETDGLLYKVTVSYNSQNIPVYVTRDGKYYVQSVANLEDSNNPSNTSDNSQTQDIPKSDKPEVELFVMSYCPYGTQAEKGILPVVELLGDKIDFKLRFVYYAMHPSQGEVEENLRQYCIQKEQEPKFNTYLECFLKEGDSQACLAEANVNTKMLNTCYNTADKEFNVSASKADTSSWLSGRYPLFNVDKDLNVKYNVGGSPTLVINGQQVSSGRSPSAMLQTICNSFTEGNVPTECSDSNLPTDSYVPGFGWTLSTGSTTDGAQCY
jgi:hypothetical protein